MIKLSLLFVFGIFVVVTTMSLVLIPEGESVYAQNGSLIGNTTAQNQTLTTQNNTLTPFGLEEARQGEAIGQEFANEFGNQNQNDPQMGLEEARQGEAIGQEFANEWR